MRILIAMTAVLLLLVMLSLVLSLPFLHLLAEKWERGANTPRRASAIAVIFILFISGCQITVSHPFHVATAQNRRIAAIVRGHHGTIEHHKRLRDKSTVYWVRCGTGELLWYHLRPDGTTVNVGVQESNHD